VANEITLTSSLTCYKPAIMASPGVSRTVNGQQSTMNGDFVSYGSLLVPANLSGTLIVGATNANPIVITTATPHNLVTGDTATITLVTGNTAANGTFLVTVIDTLDFSIPVAGNGSYVSGGTFTTPNGCVIPLGQITLPHLAVFNNLDPNNYVQLQDGQGGDVFARYDPGFQCPIPLDPTVIPWALANTSACLFEFLVLSF
jgi:hypothetical protein